MIHIKLLSAVTVIFLWNLAATHDLLEGYDFGVRMSYTEVKKHGLLFFKRHDSVAFSYPKGTKITGIACVDLSPKKKGIPKIVQGGINSSFVQIDFESEVSAGLKFTVEIYTISLKKDLKDFKP